MACHSADPIRRARFLGRLRWAGANAAGAAALLAALLATAASADQAESVKLLESRFEPRAVAKAEIGGFFFLPGQRAPVHTHAAPAVGFVARGTIVYQIEGSAPQILGEGDAFYEPAGPRILRFDNASATERAVFYDVNLQRAGEPFIVFAAPPTEAIDRRGLPTVDLGGRVVERVDIQAERLDPGAAIAFAEAMPVLGIVDSGRVLLETGKGAPRRLAAGQSFALETGRGRIANPSGEAGARVITFRLR